MLILILVDVQYLQIVFFSFEWKRLKSSKSLLFNLSWTHKTIPSAQQKLSFLPTPYSNAIWKTLDAFQTGDQSKMKLVHFVIKYMFNKYLYLQYVTL